MNIAVIGLGLIGGSMAMILRNKGWAARIVGVDSNVEHAQKALTLGIVDEVKDWATALACSDLVIVSMPVDAIAQLLPELLDNVQHQVIMDTGSTKQTILEQVQHHPSRGRFVATHPMWGTELSGPQAATTAAFTGKANVICAMEESDPDALQTVMGLYEVLGMYPVWMTGKEHDLHVAYISHIAHVTSFALANTVLEKEKEEDAIFGLASAGFESTVRLAQSNPSMWTPIFRQNRHHVLDVLTEHIQQLERFRLCLEQQDWEGLSGLMLQANRIKKVLNPKQVRAEVSE